MSSTSAPLRQHTDEEWEAVKPVIECLYLKQQRPLSTVMQKLVDEHHFKASINMYKRRLHLWGVYKNTPRNPRTRAPPVAKLRAIGAPRYLAQNCVDESIHTILDLIRPWVTQAKLLWEAGNAVNPHCPARAVYIYDDFTNGIATAAAAFASGDADVGGTKLREAFVDMERTLAPGARSRFTLDSVLFAQAVLNQAGLFEASKMLISHAADLVVAQTKEIPQIKTGPSPSPSKFQPPLAHVEESGHESHPFPQILRRLRRLAVDPSVPDERMGRIYFLVWTAYHRATTASVVGDFVVHALTRQWWRYIVRMPVRTISGAAKVARWNQNAIPVLHFLKQFSSLAENDTVVDEDSRLVNMDEMSSVYFYSHHEAFHETARKLLEKMDKRGDRSQRNVDRCDHWYNVALELGDYYRMAGDIESSIRALGYTIPDAVGDSWKNIFRQEFADWNK